MSKCEFRAATGRAFVRHPEFAGGNLKKSQLPSGMSNATVYGRYHYVVDVVVAAIDGGKAEQECNGQMRPANGPQVKEGEIYRADGDGDVAAGQG